MNIYWDLFWTLAKVGVMTFGGGYAMLPVLERELVDRKQWLTGQQLMDCYAIGQCTPGVIAVNTATFVGYRLKGLRGAVCSTLGVVFPSIVIITVIAAFIQQFSHLEAVQHAFAGIRVAVCALVLHTVIKLIKSHIKDPFSIAVLAAGFVVVAFFGVSPVIVVVAAAVCGLLYRGRMKG